VEVWKIIPSDPSLMASSHGRIQVIPWRSERGITYGGKPTKGQWDGSRYIYCRKGYKTRKVAKLVCEAFNGPQPFPEAVCMHLDENSRNNHYTNLQWGTQKENLNFPGIKAYHRSRVGDNSAVKLGMESKLGD